MNKLKKPEIKIGEKTLTPKRNPTMKMWRIITKQDERDAVEKMDMEQILDSRLKIIATIYEVDKDILDDMDVADIIPAYRDVVKWIHGLIFPKLEEIPNSEPAEEKKK